MPKACKRLQAFAAETTVDDSIISYITQIVRKTREYPGLEVGASPRAGLTILAASRVVALMDKGRDYVMPEDVLDVAFRLCATVLFYRQKPKSRVRKSILFLRHCAVKCRSPAVKKRPHKVTTFVFE